MTITDLLLSFPTILSRPAIVPAGAPAARVDVRVLAQAIIVLVSTLGAGGAVGITAVAPISSPAIPASIALLLLPAPIAPTAVALAALSVGSSAAFILRQTSVLASLADVGLLVR